MLGVRACTGEGRVRGTHETVNVDDLGRVALDGGGELLQGLDSVLLSSSTTRGSSVGRGETDGSAGCADVKVLLGDDGGGEGARKGESEKGQGAEELHGWKESEGGVPDREC